MLKKIKYEKLKKFCIRLLIEVGLPKKDAIITTEAILFANLRGVDSHGIIRLPAYIERLKAGGTNPRPKLKVIRKTPSLAIVDGNNGLGQVVGNYASLIAIEKAQSRGISFVGVKRSNHFGAASYYSIKISEKNMIGIVMSNTPPNTAAWGGSGKVIGNNPLSIAIPYKQNKTVVLDISMSRVAGGKVLLAAKNKKKIPQGWIIDKSGKNTNDPNALLNGGALLPFGEHKGYGLAFMIEILTGVLSGAGMLNQIPPWNSPANTLKNNGFCFIAIDIRQMMSITEFKNRLDWVIKQLKKSPLTEGSEGIFVPGEKEWQIEEKRKKSGIPISTEVWKNLKSISDSYKIYLE